MSLKKPLQNTAIKLIKTGHQCSKCGAEMVEVIKNGVRLNHEYCQECTKRQQEEQERQNVKNDLKKIQLSRYYDESFFSDNEQKKASFETFEIENEEQEKALQLMRTIYKSELKNEPIHAMLIGKTGTGKSHLTASMCLKLIENTSKGVCFVSWRNYIEARKTAYSAKYDDLKPRYRYIELFERYKNVDVLVIDDLGAEEDSETNKRALESILDARVNKTTIITTNVPRKEFKTVYGQRATSRYKSCGGVQNIVEMVNTKDYRGEL